MIRPWPSDLHWPYYRWAASRMVRRGSAVRVRQKALQSRANRGFRLFDRLDLHELQYALARSRLWSFQIQNWAHESPDAASARSERAARSSQVPKPERR
jgi:hypothetical protein